MANQVILENQFNEADEDEDQSDSDEKPVKAGHPRSIV